MLARFRTITSRSSSTSFRRSPAHASFQTNQRPYSFESGPKRKPDGSLESSDPSEQVSSSDSLDPNKPVSISSNSASVSAPVTVPVAGRGRRASSRSRNSSVNRSRNKPTLPFEPLSSDHLAHLRPKTLSLDIFFSLQRPLLEIELSPSDRRSITSESKQSQHDPEVELADYQEHHNILSSDIYGSEIDNEPWVATDPYRPYLLAEPEGVHPAWSSAVKHYLASCPALVPPPPPKPSLAEDDDVEVQALAMAEARARAGPTESQEAQECEREISRRRAVEFLAPYGTNPTSELAEEHQLEDRPGRQTAEMSPLPAISQDPITLTLQAAKFLHSGMTAVQAPTATSWATLNSQLAAAEESYTGTVSSTQAEGQDRTTTGRRNRQSFQIKFDTSTGQTISLSEKQLAQIIKYSQKILSNDQSGLNGSVPKDVLASLERLGEFLMRKHVERSKVIVNEEPLGIVGVGLPSVVVEGNSTTKTDNDGDADQSRIVELDSVFRKKKRKMKVHKYKKRRKARRTLRKRQGRD